MNKILQSNSSFYSVHVYFTIKNELLFLIFLDFKHTYTFYEIGILTPH